MKFPLHYCEQFYINTLASFWNSEAKRGHLSTPKHLLSEIKWAIFVQIAVPVVFAVLHFKHAQPRVAWGTCSSLRIMGWGLGFFPSWLSSGDSYRDELNPFAAKWCVTRHVICRLFVTMRRPLSIVTTWPGWSRQPETYHTSSEMRRAQKCESDKIIIVGLEAGMRSYINTWYGSPFVEEENLSLIYYSIY